MDSGLATALVWLVIVLLVGGGAAYAALRVRRRAREGAQGMKGNTATHGAKSRRTGCRGGEAGRGGGKLDFRGRNP